MHELKFRELPTIKDTKLIEEYSIQRIQAEIERRSSKLGFWDNADGLNRLTNLMIMERIWRFQDRES